ncbi:hypothetical protein AAT19DRAFT_10795 [Rhodotorula toruloides]|uniref:Uncharacterized protein n=1 Tax=Rhodotorula toruloides TaxID=5286 RepID=A0A2S9ZXZ2_RHOTO|nr:hypothetical protein AAT19DRAFT_10795 [Rhodotorula toruloides]
MVRDESVRREQSWAGVGSSCARVHLLERCCFQNPLWPFVVAERDMVHSREGLFSSRHPPVLLILSAILESGQRRGSSTSKQGWERDLRRALVQPHTPKRVPSSREPCWRDNPGHLTSSTTSAISDCAGSVLHCVRNNGASRTPACDGGATMASASQARLPLSYGGKRETRGVDSGYRGAGEQRENLRKKRSVPLPNFSLPALVAVRQNDLRRIRGHAMQ